MFMSISYFYTNDQTLKKIHAYYDFVERICWEYFFFHAFFFMYLFSFILSFLSFLSKIQVVDTLCCFYTVRFVFDFFFPWANGFSVLLAFKMRPRISITGSVRPSVRRPVRRSRFRHLHIPCFCLRFSPKGF